MCNLITDIYIVKFFFIKKIQKLKKKKRIK